MRKYEIRILMQCGTTQQWITETIEAVEFWSSEKGYYYFQTENGKSKFYPINNTIIEEI